MIYDPEHDALYDYPEPPSPNEYMDVAPPTPEMIERWRATADVRDEDFLNGGHGGPIRTTDYPDPF